jgi:tRNA(Ile)-lysidine synthase
MDLIWRLGYPLVVAHLNHGLRAEADEDALAVQEVAQNHELPFIVKKIDITAFARSKSLSIEEAARIARYQFLFEQAGLHEAQAVSVAHTADDQVETILMHLLRGTGLSGLKGMRYRTRPNPWSTEIPLVRPLLGVFREEVLVYCSEWDLHPVFDRSNLDTTFFRNRIRRELIPELETYSSNFKQILWRMAQIIDGDNRVLDLYTADAWQNSCLEQRSGSVVLKMDGLLAQPLGIQRRIIRRAISILRPGLRDIDFATIEKVLYFLRQPAQNGEWDLANGMRMLREGETLSIADWVADLPTSDWPQMDKTPLQLTIPGCLDMLNGWRIQAEVITNIQEAISQALNNPHPYEAWIDTLDNQRSIIVRTLIPGDRFQPHGMEGHSVKLSDFFINVKVPRRARRNWPLITLGDEIAWIPGYRLAHQHRLQSNTRHAIHLKLFKG